MGHLLKVAFFFKFFYLTNLSFMLILYMHNNDIEIFKNNKKAIKDVGKRFLEFRESLGKTQSEFAQALNHSETIILEIEKGNIFPSVECLKILFIDFRLSINWLSEGKGEMFINNDKTPSCNSPSNPNPFPIAPSNSSATSDANIPTTPPTSATSSTSKSTTHIPKRRPNKNNDTNGQILFRDGTRINFNWICKGIKGDRIPYWLKLADAESYAIRNIRFDMVSSIEFVDFTSEERIILGRSDELKSIMKANVKFLDGNVFENIYLDYNNWLWKNSYEIGYIGKRVQLLTVHAGERKRCERCGNEFFQMSYNYCPFDSRKLVEITSD
jgi:DNA-binding XRE family transcriptional regulator